MDIKDFGKQLDGISSNNPFDNVIFLPNDVANILPKFIYWNKEMEALWIQNPNEEDYVKRLSASFFVTIKTNEKGLFINGNLVVQWDNKRFVKDNAVMYQSHGVVLALMETGILCKFGDDEIDSIIQFNVDSDIKEFIEKNQSTYTLLSLCNYSYWKKEEICVVSSTETKTPKYRGKIMANETGLYLDGELRNEWNDYFPIIRKKNDKEQICLLKRTALANWGDSRYGFYPQKNYFVIGNGIIMDKDETILIGHTCKLLCNYDSLYEKKDLPILKKSYNSLEIKNDIVFSPNIRIEHERNSKNVFYLHFNFKWIEGTSIICLDFHDAFLKIVNDNLEPIFSSRFKEGTFTIVLDKKIEYTLKLATSISGKENQNKCDCYNYDIDKNILRKMGFAERLDIKLKGKDCEYSINANELINLANTFDEELFSSPKHEMDYYKANFLFEKKEYLDANRYILAAVKEVADNAQYNELANILGNKIKEYRKKALKILGILSILLIGLVVYSNVKSYIDEQEHKEYIAAKKERIKQIDIRNKQVNKAIETRLNEICKDLSTYDDTDKYLSQEFKNLLNKGGEIGGPNFYNCDIWLNAQDWETITVEILQFRNHSEKRVNVELYFIDSSTSYTYKKPKQTITFIFEEENWFVDDIINIGGTSLKKYAKDYVNRYR